MKFKNKIIISILLLSLIGCRKEPDKTPPVFSLLTDSTFTFTDCVVPIGFPFKIGLKATATGSAITNLVITLTTENGIETAVDTGIYTKNLNYIKTLSYGASAYEKWTFTIRDKAGNMLSKSIKLTKDPNSEFGQINYYPSIILGTQHSPSIGSFLSLSDMHLITTDSATYYQNTINIITYWGDLLNPVTEFTFSSPEETDAPVLYPNINSWTTPRNEMRYKADSTSIPISEFDNAYNDSLIISNYTSATVGKRKFKMVRTGYVIPFQITSGPSAGRRGLIKVKTLQNTADGQIEIALKIQQ